MRCKEKEAVNKFNLEVWLTEIKRMSPEDWTFLFAKAVRYNLRKDIETTIFLHKHYEQIFKPGP